MPDGSKVPIREEFGKVPFCEDFTTNEENTKMAYHVRYRPSVKLPPRRIKKQVQILDN